MTASLHFIRDFLIDQGFRAELELEFAKFLGRKWRFDLAVCRCPIGESHAMDNPHVALEIDGGLFVGGRHTRGQYIVRTHEKENTAALLGWVVLKCQPVDVESLRALNLVRAALDDEERIRWISDIAMIKPRQSSASGKIKRRG